ncbi:hypothetical protein CPC08DRAFT_24996 [Agrocybe pediades]|nr:hypothetical protein CPC08DRAFT_24996 [Agrocybe pediades]
MSLYPNPPVVDKSLSWTSAYYQSSDSAACSLSMPHSSSIQSRNHDWSPYYVNDASQASSSSSFAAYPNQLPTESSSTCGSSWRDSMYSREIHPRSQQLVAEDVYQTSILSMPVPGYPIMPQRAVLSSPTNQSTTLPHHGLRNTRNDSPSSRTSSSDYGTGTKGWDSPLSSVESYTRYTPSQIGAAEEDESAERPKSKGCCFPVSELTHISTRSLVKVEPSDQVGCFISENSAFVTSASTVKKKGTSSTPSNTSSLFSQLAAPPTEVPLRATQASKPMRRMMGVFRLNPFAMHSLSTNADEENIDVDAQAPWCGEPRPLEEEPVMFEFQLQLEGLDIADDHREGHKPESEEASPVVETPTSPTGDNDQLQLRSFSPGFELHPDDAYDSILMATEGALRNQKMEKMQASQEARSGSCSGTDSDQSEVDSTDIHSIPSALHQSPRSSQAREHTPYETSSDDHSYFPPPSTTTWKASPQQYHANTVYPSSAPASQTKFEVGYPGGKPRLHTTISHPYLRKASMPHLGMKHPQGHSNLATYGPARAISMSGHSILHLPTHHTQRETHTPTLNDHSLQRHGFNVPMNPGIGEIPSSVLDYQTRRTMIGAGGAGAYMRVEHDFELPARDYSPSSASSMSNEASGYSSVASQFPAPLNVQDDQYVATGFTTMRRWSLPDMLAYP